MEVKIKCRGSGEISLDKIIPFQGDLKDLSGSNYKKLKKQILTHGMVAPFMLWKGNCIDGHQRLKTLLKMKEEGIKLPELFPMVEIEAKDEKTAKKIVLAISSQYGKITEESLFDFSKSFDLGFKEMEESFNFDAFDFKDYEKKYGESKEVEGEDDIPESAPVISKLGDIWYLGAYYECEKCKKEFSVTEANSKKMVCDVCPS